MSLSYYNYNGNPITGSFQLQFISLTPSTNTTTYNTNLSINDYNVMVVGFSLDGSPATVGYYIGNLGDYRFFAQKNTTTNTWIIIFSGQSSNFYIYIILLVIPTNTGLFNTTPTYSISGQSFLYGLSLNSDLVANNTLTTYYPIPVGFDLPAPFGRGLYRVILDVLQYIPNPTQYQLKMFCENPLTYGSLNFLTLNNNIFTNTNFKVNTSNPQFVYEKFTNVGTFSTYNQSYDTGYSTTDWVACVVGFQINYGNNAHYYWQCFASQNNGTWCIYAGDFVDGTTGTITVDFVTVLFISTQYFNRIDQVQPPGFHG